MPGSNTIVFNYPNIKFTNISAPNGDVGFNKSSYSASYSNSSYSNSSYSSYSSAHLGRQITVSNHTRGNGNFTGNSKLFT